MENIYKQILLIKPNKNILLDSYYINIATVAALQLFHRYVNMCYSDVTDISESVTHIQI